MITAMPRMAIAVHEFDSSVKVCRDEVGMPVTLTPSATWLAQPTTCTRSPNSSVGVEMSTLGENTENVPGFPPEWTILPSFILRLSMGLIMVLMTMAPLQILEFGAGGTYLVTIALTPFTTLFMFSYSSGLSP